MSDSPLRSWATLRQAGVLFYFLSYLDFVEFLIRCVNTFNKFEKKWLLFFQVLFSPFSLSFPAGLSLYVCWYSWWYLTIFSGSVYFPFLFFLFHRLNKPNWSAFRCADFFFICETLLLIPSSKFFILVTMLFNSIASIWFYFIIHYLYWYYLSG